jgi:uncharacterized membrane protein YraQ (UPF0718 family)
VLEYSSAIVTQTIALFIESAPWLLFGFLVAGLLHAVGFGERAKRYITTPGWRSVLIASAIGIPLPLCSCSVIPVAIALRRKGASAGATASFFISAPQIGIDSFLLTVGLLGVPFAVARVVISFLTAMLAGILIDHFVHETAKPTEPVPACCRAGSQSAEIGQSPSFLENFVSGLYSTVLDLRLYLLIGFLAAGAIAALVPPDALSNFGSQLWVSYLVAAAIGVPTYICATSSTPLAATLVAKGVSFGAALVFLLAGPASNIATIAAFRKEMGGRATWLYLLTIVFVSVVCGAIVDGLGMKLVAEHLTHEHGTHDLFATAAAVGLLVLLVLPSLPSGKPSHAEHC